MTMSRTYYLRAQAVSSSAEQSKLDASSSSTRLEMEKLQKMLISDTKLLFNRDNFNFKRHEKCKHTEETRKK